MRTPRPFLLHPCVVPALVALTARARVLACAPVAHRLLFSYTGSVVLTYVAADPIEMLVNALALTYFMDLDDMLMSRARPWV